MAEKPVDELTSRLKRQRSSSLRKLSIISLNGITNVWKKNSLFGNKFQLGSEAPYEEVRDRVLELIGDGSEYDARDVFKARHNNWFVQRFVLDRIENTYADREDLIEDSATAIVECMKWRKDEGINDLKSSDFPREFFSSNTSMIGKDQNGNPLLFTRAKYHAKINEWHELIKMKESYFYEAVDQKLEGRQVGLILDLNGCGIRNFDLDYTMHVFELFSKYYPMTCCFLYVNDVAWIMRPGISLLMRIVPKKYSKHVKFTTRKQLHQLIGKEFLPFYLGGEAEMDVVVPSDCPTLDQVAERHGIADSAREAMRRQLQAAERALIGIQETEERQVMLYSYPDSPLDAIAEWPLLQLQQQQQQKRQDEEEEVGGGGEGEQREPANHHHDHRIVTRNEIEMQDQSAGLSSEKDSSNCLALPSEIHVTKEETDNSGNVVRVCEGTIRVAKCEGTCLSSLQPSVNSQTGFSKKCLCCRESIMKMKRFQLTECFSPDGVKISDPERGSMTIQLKEPSDCSCHNCGL